MYGSSILQMLLELVFEELTSNKDAKKLAHSVKTADYMPHGD